MNADSSQPLSREEILSALFANMVLSQANLALMMLGKVPHPQTGESFQDLESARMFIDQLEMLEVKTRGNLNKEEQGLLTQSLTQLRMAFVETVGQAGGKTSSSAPTDERKPNPAESSATENPSAESDAIPAPGDTDDSRKKFSKKY